MLNLIRWGKVESLQEEKVFKMNQLEVKVDLNPIGGYRGKVGTLTINHVENRKFTDWNGQDLNTLAQLTQFILNIQENAGVHNTLIFARQDQQRQGQFKLSLVPYPKCTWITEKIAGFIHIIFGSPTLKVKQAQEIAQFYRTQFNNTLYIQSEEGKHREGKPDPFCRPAVINNQNIADLAFGKDVYHLLHDNRPKGATAQDPHFLIVPKGDSGHCDGSKISHVKRFHLFKIAQTAMKVLQGEGYSTLLYLERNGTKLQGVQHKTGHVMGIRQFPESFLAKLRVLMRQVYPSTLSAQYLKERIQHYQQFIGKYR